MTRIVVSMWTTLDGYVAGPDDEMDWLEPDDQMMTYETALVTDADGLLLGRVTHGDFAGSWPAVARNDTEPPAVRAYARRVDEMPKIVVSRSGRTADWANTSRLDTIDAQTVARWEKGDGAPTTAEKLLRVVYLAHSNADATAHSVVESLNAIERAMKQTIVLHERQGLWEPSIKDMDEQQPVAHA